MVLSARWYCVRLLGIVPQQSYVGWAQKIPNDRILPTLTSLLQNMLQNVTSQEPVENNTTGLKRLLLYLVFAK